MHWLCVAELRNSFPSSTNHRHKPLVRKSGLLENKSNSRCRADHLGDTPALSLPHETRQRAVVPGEGSGEKNVDRDRVHSRTRHDAGQQRFPAPLRRLEVSEEHRDGEVPARPPQTERHLLKAPLVRGIFMEVQMAHSVRLQADSGEEESQR